MQTAHALKLTGKQAHDVFSDGLKYYKLAVDIISQDEKRTIKIRKSLEKRDSSLEPPNNCTFKELNTWIRDTFPANVQSRNPQCITKDELLAVMTWKLCRGKWRPMLFGLVSSNPSDLIERVSTEALKQTELPAMNKKLCELKGVGPATATAILSHLFPEKCAFMSDELLEACDFYSPKYTVKENNAVQDELAGFAELLGNWHVADVERAILGIAHKQEHGLNSEIVDHENVDSPVKTADNHGNVKESKRKEIENSISAVDTDLSSKKSKKR